MCKQTDRMWRRAEAEEKLSKWEAVFGHLGTPDEVGNEWLALTDRLKKVEAANKEWLEKTEWVQAEINNWMLPMRYLGQHRADVIRAEVDALRAKIETMERQEPVAFALYSGWARKAVYLREIEACEQRDRRQLTADLGGSLEAYRVVPLYLAPGAQGEEK